MEVVERRQQASTPRPGSLVREAPLPHKLPPSSALVFEPKPREGWWWRWWRDGSKHQHRGQGHWCVSTNHRRTAGLTPWLTPWCLQPFTPRRWQCLHSHRMAPVACTSICCRLHAWTPNTAMSCIYYCTCNTIFMTAGVVLITPRVTQSSFCQRNSDTNARAARCSSSEAPKRCVYRQRQRQAARQNVTL